MSITLRITAWLSAGALATVLTIGTADARCSAVRDCTLRDFKNAAGAKGCELLFIDSRYENCAGVRESLKSADACGGGKIEGDGRIPGPGRCEAGSDNEHILKRWQLCLEDRETQAAAFASGLNDIKAARKIKWANNGQAIKEYLKEIQGKIKDDQPGHAEEIRGVKNAIAHCQKFHPQHGDGASNIPIPTPIEILTLD